MKLSLLAQVRSIPAPSVASIRNFEFRRRIQNLSLRTEPFNSLLENRPHRKRFNALERIY